MKVIIDRFEGQLAVCEREDGSMMQIAKKDIPTEALEGDVLRIGDSIVLDQEASRGKQRQIDTLTRDLWK